MNKVRLAQLDDKESIVELLNKVTLNLHQKGINQWTYPWDSKEIELGIKNKQIYVFETDGLMVGTFSLKSIENFNNILVEQNSMYLYRIAILPEYQGKNQGKQIVNFAFRHSTRLKKPLYLDCWAGNVKLKDFYNNAGFDYMGDFPEEDYMISVFKHNKR